MNYHMNHIGTYASGGIVSLLSSRRGYAFYPIAYKEIKYVVDFSIVLNRPVTQVATFDDYVDGAKVIAHVYEQREKHSFFYGLKGTKEYETDITTITVGDNQELDLRRTKRDDLKIHLPEIMQIIFDRWEHDKQANTEKRAAVKAAEAWDGVVR